MELIRCFLLGAVVGVFVAILVLASVFDSGFIKSVAMWAIIGGVIGFVHAHIEHKKKLSRLR